MRPTDDGRNTRNAAKVGTILSSKWPHELDYWLIKELWAFIVIRIAYEWRDDSGNWFRSYGNKIGSSPKTG